MQPVRHPARRQSPARGGFSLIELMVVVVIIAILAALLFPAIRGEVQTAREATVTVEIASFDKAMVEFKNRYGVEVPSFIVLYEQGEGVGDPDWGTDTSTTLPLPADGYRRTSRAFIRQIWPDFDFTYGGGGSIDLNNNGTSDEVLILDGSECLVFFLGGVMTRGALPGLVDDTPIGFAANGQNPFDTTSTNNRVGPFVDDFLGDRFTDVDGDGMPEYKDGLSGQQRPYVYVSSYGGSGYKVHGLDNVQGNADDEISPLLGLTDAYYKSLGPPKTYFNPQTFQLFSPGSDFDFGDGGLYDGNKVTGPTAAEQRDNITNFKGGRLN